MQRDERPATAAQIEYARDLILKLGYDLDWYDLDKMTRGQNSGENDVEATDVWDAEDVFRKLKVVEYLLGSDDNIAEIMKVAKIDEG